MFGAFIYERKKTYMNEIITLFAAHILFLILLYAVIFDTFLGVFRAIKERKFNSCVGIDGAIRKAAMILSVVFFMLIDSVIKINFLFIIPEKYLQVIGMDRVGICELFCLLFIAYEAISILKNMMLCGLPVPAKLRKWLMKFLDDMTDELPEEVIEELHGPELQEENE